MGTWSSDLQPSVGTDFFKEGGGHRFSRRAGRPEVGWFELFRRARGQRAQIFSEGSDFFGGPKKCPSMLP